jgi:hypothetical protein
MQPLQRVGDAAALRGRSSERMGAATSVLVHVFRDIGEVRKIGKCPHDVQCIADRQGIQETFEFGTDCRSLVGLRAMKSNRGLADRLDTRERGFAGLRANDVAQDAAEEASIFFEREILVSGDIHGASGPVTGR